MFSRRVKRFFYTGLDLIKCNIHDLRKVADANTKEAVGKRLKVQGWVRAMRKMKNNVFLDVSDGLNNDMLQIVLSKERLLSNLNYGCSVSVEGDVKLGPNGKVELHADDVRVIGTCDLVDGYPFLPRIRYAPEYVRQQLHFRPRTRTFSSTLRLRNVASYAIHEHFRNRDFVNINTPILTSNDCENAGEVFVVKPDSKEMLKSMHRDGISEDDAYFSGKAYLTVSGQLHLEIAARAISKVYSFGPTFRAENSKSRTHLSEFYMIEAELAFVTQLETLMEEIELLVKNVTKEVVTKGASDLRNVGSSEPQWLDKKFNCLTYEEAINILQNHSDRLTMPVKHGEALAKEHELFLVDHNGGIPVFIINWPKDQKPFYMKECIDDSSKVAALDLLAPVVGELVGGSLREDDYEKLKEKLPPNDNLTWYLELRKYGNVPTGGFGIGFERYLQSVLGITNIKDTIPFPRWPHNCFL